MNKFRKKIYVWLLFVCILSINVFSMPLVKAASGVEVKYEVIRDWKCGLTGKITILNNSSKDLDQWKLEFDWDRKILNVRNAKIESSNNNHYIISFSQCNKVIPSGKCISLELRTSAGGSSTEPANLSVKDIYDKLASEDAAWQQYKGMKTSQEFQKSFAHGFSYLWSIFPVDEPHRIGYEIIEKSPMEQFIQAKYQDVSFKTWDGITLKGYFFPVKKAKGTIIMLHGYGSTAIWETPKLKYLLDNGYQIFSYNARYWNYFKTPEKYVELMSNEVKDIQYAVNYLKTRHDVDKNKLGIYGFSYGSCKAELFVPFSKDIKLTIFDGGNAHISTYSPDITWDMVADDVMRITTEEYGSDPNSFPAGMLPSPYTNAMAKMDKPSLFIHGLKDSIPVSEVEALYNAVSGPKEKYIFENSGHCEAMYTVDKDAYEKRVLDFLAKYF